MITINFLKFRLPNKYGRGLVETNLLYILHLSSTC